MSGRTSAALESAMRMVRAGVKPKYAAERAGIALSTMYRAADYKLWREAEKAKKAKTQTRRD